MEQKLLYLGYSSQSYSYQFEVVRKDRGPLAPTVCRSDDNLLIIYLHFFFFFFFFLYLPSCIHKFTFM